MQNKFEEKWKNYESDLQKYLKNTKKYEDWMCRTDEFGKESWFNIKVRKITSLFMIITFIDRYNSIPTSRETSIHR